MSKYDKEYRMYIDFEIPATLDVKKVEEFLLQLADESDYVMHDESKSGCPVSSSWTSRDPAYR